MNMKIGVLTVLMLLSQILLGQENKNGYVRDLNGAGLIGAVVSINESQVQVTNVEGQFTIASDDEQIMIKIESVGFEDLNAVIDLDTAGRELVFVMMERSFDLPNVTVEGVSMTGGLKGVNKILGSAHYIGKREIQKFSHTDINRILSNIPGVNIQEEDGYGLRPNIGLRATGSERSSKITVMEDGILSAPAPYAAPAAYYFPTVGRMSAIEIMKGSSQVKYGPYTTGGAINLISTPIPNDFSGQADFITGSNNFKMLHANIGNSHEQFAYLVETMQFSTDGFKQLDNGGETGFNKEDYLAKFRINTRPNARIYQSLTVKVGQTSEISNETYLGLSREDFNKTPYRRYASTQRDKMTSSHRQLSLSHFINLSENVQIRTTGYRSSFSRNWYKLDKVGGVAIGRILNNPADYIEEFGYVTGALSGGTLIDVKANNRLYSSSGIQSNATINLKSSRIDHKLEIGLRYHMDDMDRFQWVDQFTIDNGTMFLKDAGMPGTESNRIDGAKAFAGFMQYELKTEHWTVLPGARFESISMSRIDYGQNDVERTGNNLANRSNHMTVFIPGIAISRQLNNKSNIFVGIHKGFAPAGSREGTRPEQSWNSELGYKYQSGDFKFHSLVYYNDYQNLLGSDFAATGGLGTGDLFNGGGATAAGVELELAYDLMRTNTTLAMPIQASYTFSRATFKRGFNSELDVWGTVNAGDHLPYVPTHQFSLNWGLESSKVSVNISMKYQTEMLAVAGQFSTASLERTDASLIIDASASYRLTPQLSAFTNVNNLTDAVNVVALRPAGLRPNLPRILNVGLKANF